MIGLDISHAGAYDNDTLLKMIEEKNSELKKIQAEREKLETNLDSVLKTKGSLSKEVQTLEYNIRQLNLAMESNKVAISKLELEMESINSDVQDVKKKIANKKETVNKLMLEVYQRDRDPFFLIFLRSETLAEGVSELQNLVTMNNDLTVSVDELRSLQDDLVAKAAAAERKKKEKEIEAKNLVNRQYIVNDEKEEKQKLLSVTKSQEKFYADQIEELDKQQTEISKVLSDIEYQLRQNFDPTLLPIKRSGVLAYPIQNAPMSQDYGNTKFAERAYRTKFHNGIDFAARIGTPIFAAEDGVVKAADNNDKGTLRWQKYQYGMHIVIEHPNNLSTLYAHLSKILVRVGASVKRGDLIGYSGNSGYATGPHLHFSVYWSKSVEFKPIPPAAGLVPVGVTVDPTDYL